MNEKEVKDNLESLEVVRCTTTPTTEGREGTKHVSGYIVYLEEAPVMHRSAMQKTVTLSICEVELNTAA